MLNNIDKLYLKTYRARYGVMDHDEIIAACTEAENDFNNSFPGSDNQRKAAATLNELIVYLTLNHIETTGDNTGLIFMGTGVYSSTDGMMTALPQEVKSYMKNSKFDYCHMSNTQDHWFTVYVDVCPSSQDGKALREMFNTNNTAPRMALRSFVFDRIIQQTP